MSETTSRVAPSGALNAVEPAASGWAYVIALSCVAALGGFLFGFDSAVVNGTVDALALAFGTRAATTGFAVASVLIGCAIGAFVAGQIADRYGRRPTMLLNAVIFLASAFATGAAGSAGFFIASRLAGGLGIGAASVLAPMYISEVAPAGIRGRLASLQQMAIVLGLFFAFLSNDILARIAGGASGILWLGAPAWRWMFWMEAVPSAAFLIGILFIPESPRHLVARGRADEARRVFARIGGDADALVREVGEALRGDHRPRLADLLLPGTRRLAPVVWVGLGLAAFQQFVGINIIFYFGEVLWKAAGATEQWALRINLLTGLVNILATIPAIALIDRVGRKPLLLAGSIGMALTLGSMATIFASAGTGPDGKPMLTQGAAVMGLTAANLYIVAFAMSWGPVMWVLLGEMFPNRMRGAALAVSGAMNWAANFAVTVTFLPLMNAIGLSSAYALYALAAVVSAPFVWRAVRETKGRTLEQMG
ncbi:MAG TPA: sugar porter family MFS transporter [Candidatus Polarisedimenticolia bacterium]|nr:sugar porter family MFS transporter [Candidatus Polarisedimenticolia bacterium]